MADPFPIFYILFLPVGSPTGTRPGYLTDASLRDTFFSIFPCLCFCLPPSFSPHLPSCQLLHTASVFPLCPLVCILAQLSVKHSSCCRSQYFPVTIIPPFFFQKNMCCCCCCCLDTNCPLSVWQSHCWLWEAPLSSPNPQTQTPVELYDFGFASPFPNHLSPFWVSSVIFIIKYPPLHIFSLPL